MSKVSLLFLTSIFLIGSSVHASTCVPASNQETESFLKGMTVTPDPCDYYLCLEKQMKCDSYLETYGFYYCKKFSKNYAKFSTEGKAWITQTMACLQQEIASTSFTCNDLKENTITSHLRCYQRTNFCGLKSSDKMEILQTMEAREILNPTTLWSAAGFVAQCIF